MWLHCTGYRGYADFEIPQQTVPQIVNPSMDSQRLSAIPSLADGGDTADRLHLCRDIEFAEPPPARSLVAQPLELHGVRGAHIPDTLKPPLDFAVQRASERGLHAAAAVVAADDDTPE